MCSLKRHAISVALILGITLSAASALAQTAQKQGTGVITGRVTSGDKGIANVPVQLYAQDRFSNRSALASAKTDYQGNYRLTNVPAGRYTISAVAPTMVAQSDSPYGDPGKLVTLAEGETVEKIDFTLVRGGVITGRITDADGAPVVEEHIQLNQVGQQGPMRSSMMFNPFMSQTDDRGIYRLYGIPPGNYTVSVGASKENGFVSGGGGRRGYFTLTYYPSVTEQSKATVIEVKEGSEASNIDITLGRQEKTYVATGRVVDENGQPVPNISIGYSALTKEGQTGGFMTGMPSDTQGRFRFEGLLPGRYVATLWTYGNNSPSGYSALTHFEVLDSDISGLEIKMKQGATLSGVAVVEGTTDRSVLSQLSQVWIIASPVGDRSQMMLPDFSRTKVAPDGTFTIKGLRPGKFNLYLSSFPPVPGFKLSRVEHDGAAQREFEVTQGAQITGVRLVIQYGSGSIRGVVKTDGDSLPDFRRMSLGIRPLVTDPTANPQGPVVQVDQMGRFSIDSRGRFLIEGLSTGEYEVILYISPNDGERRRPASVRQRVTVTNGFESEVTLTINTNKPEGSNNE
jgi:protocatechuate 3,4-dioxygenase beta subunit